MSMKRFLTALLVASLAAACGRTSSAPAPASTATDPASRTADPGQRKYLLERVDDAAVVQLYADSFNELPLRDKTLIWHLYQAGLAGRDIYIDQKHRNALEMRGILDQIVAHPQGIDPATFAEIQRYTKLFWLNNGPYNNLTARKFVLKTTPDAFAAAAKAAQAAGATFTTAGGETLDAMLQRLQPMFFDPNVDASVTTKAPPPGKDILTASANNLYAGGVTTNDLKGFTEKYGLNARLVKENGKLTEEVYKIDGRYSKQIAAIVQHLQDAIPFATEPMQNALRALIQWYRTASRATARNTTSRGWRTRRRRWTPSTVSSRCISTRGASREAGRGSSSRSTRRRRNSSRRSVTTRSGSKIARPPTRSTTSRTSRGSSPTPST